MGSLRPQESFAAAPADPNEALAPYTPGAGRPWDRRHAAHLLRRAGFGGSLEEIDAIVALGPAAGARSLAAARARSRRRRARPSARGGPRRRRRPAPPRLVVPADGAHERADARKVGIVPPRPLRHRFPKSGIGAQDARPGRALPRSRRREVPRPHGRRREGRGDARLPRRRAEREAPSQRKPRARADGIVHSRPRQPYGDRRPEAARALTGWRVDARGSHFIPRPSTPAKRRSSAAAETWDPTTWSTRASPIPPARRSSRGSCSSSSRSPSRALRSWRRSRGACASAISISARRSRFCWHRASSTPMPAIAPA